MNSSESSVTTETTYYSTLIIKTMQMSHGRFKRSILILSYHLTNVLISAQFCPL